MTVEEFCMATFGQLATITGVDRHRWSKYVSGKISVTERTLQKVAPRLGMAPDEILRAIQIRRSAPLRYIYGARCRKN